MPAQSPPDTSSSSFSDGVPEAMSLAHVSHTFKRYRFVIAAAMAIIMIAYSIIAVIVYIRAPSQRIAAQPFRLDFEGAGEGQYPNGLKFSPADITAAPNLLRVYQGNNLQRFTSLETFANSLSTLRSNREYEKLAGQYQAKLFDPRLSPIDRERLESEYETKLASLSKSGYALTYVVTDEAGRIPPTLENKVLSDVLATWANQALLEKRVLDYQIPVLSAKILERLPGHDDDPISLIVLRSRMAALMVNVAQLGKMPGIDLVRPHGSKASLSEVTLEIQDITRYRIEPLISYARTAGAAGPGTIQILESQLAFDQRSLTDGQERVAAFKEAFLLYQARRSGDVSPSSTAPPDHQATTPETVMPQLSESFINRIVELANQSGDRVYRQRSIEDVKNSSLALVPLQSAVTYDQQLLADFKATKGAGATSANTAKFIRQQRDQIYADLTRVVGELNDIYLVGSKQLNASTQLFTLTAPVARRIERSTSLSRLALYWILVFLLSIPVVIAACFIHNRIAEEESTESNIESAESA